MTNIAYIICSILSFIPAIVLHEVSHGWVAFKLGDPTAKSQGRLSLNPLKHVDPFGTVILPLILMVASGPIFGYAKPVPYNPRYFEDKRKGDLLVGLAGPAANLVMALVGTGLAWLCYWIALNNLALLQNPVFSVIFLTFIPLFILINLYLMFFNLLPIPPLDGSSIWAFILPEKFLPAYYTVERYAMPILLILLIVLPYVLNVNPISAYLGATAGNLFDLITPYA